MNIKIVEKPNWINLDVMHKCHKLDLTRNVVGYVKIIFFEIHLDIS